MCGITGFVNRHHNYHMKSVCDAMVDTLRHRGPNDHDVWCDQNAGVVLGHSRLSIIDLSSAGHQPMASANGRWIIVYNGEVYNAHALRRELSSTGITFNGHSDTEVILEAVATWGLEQALQRFIGMFALALWDRQTSTLYLIRDRLGIKPLYWGQFGSLFLFGSELKALRAHPGWKPLINREALTGFLRYNYIPTPLSIYEGVYKLRPGHMLVIQNGSKPIIRSYWDLRSIAVDGVNHPDVNDAHESIQHLDDLLRDAVGRRMVADVPLGALLSGGVDSSLVAALMQAQSTAQVKTFSIGFHEQGYDEAQHARKVAEHLGTDHTELYVEPGHAMDILPSLCEWYDEPFADASQIPTYLVSELTRRHVTVALSGDGGDELFGGYTRYFWARSLWERLRILPDPMRRIAAAGIRKLSPQSWDRIAKVVPQRYRPTLTGDKAYKLADILAIDNPDIIYRRLISQWQMPEQIVRGGSEPFTAVWDDALRNDLPDFTDRMQLIDTLTYLPDDILTKVDRASMAVSLEARVPLLDHRVVEFAWRQQRDRKIQRGQGKWLLRQVLYQYVPRALIERPKMGFGVPIDTWLRGPLREWAEELLDEKRMQDDGLLNPEPIRAKWKEHLTGERNWQYPLWGVLMFQAWHKRWMSS